ncbi:MAG: hypothetical protein M1840_002115 [Geoglossum simile]|nr:MAG: hypothetical protein M1840_002115 [Geoglossum simile]
MPAPKCIQRWPGREHRIENKVPTKLTYDSGTLTSWGFLCNAPHVDDNPNRETYQWFKLLLNPNYLETMRDVTIHDVRRRYKDYLHCLYQHIEWHLDKRQRSPMWRGRVEFIFSVPTTWTNQSMIADYRALIREAGFGSGRDHEVEIGLTEAEAAAVFATRDSLHSYVDIAVLEVKSSMAPYELKQLDTVKGTLSLPFFSINVGSTQIDEEFQKLAIDRLSQLERYATFRRDAISKMTDDLFQITKESFNGSLQEYTIEVPGLENTFSLQQLGIDRGRLVLRRAELQALFDQQIARICDLIDKQLDRMNEKMPSKQISNLILSGGLGSSVYVQECLTRRYGFNLASPYANARNMEVILSGDAQLAVCQGLVMDRIQKLKFNRSIIDERCCRKSYGMVCMEPYNKDKHLGQRTWKDPLDKKLYVPEQIDWFIKQGQPVSTEKPIEHTFTRKIDPSRPRVTWTSRLIESDVLDEQYLPYNLSQSNAKVCCTLESDLTHLPLANFKKKNHHFYSRGNPYFRASYSVRVIIGPADLRFELWMGGTKYSKDRPIAVEWEPVVANGGATRTERRDGVRRSA